jgi:hypothetical protein
MKKYLFNLTINHPGKFLTDKLTSKLNLIVTFNQDRIDKGESCIEITSSLEAMQIPVAYVALHVESYEIEWVEENEFTQKWLTISPLDQQGKGLKLELIATDSETEILAGFPVLIKDEEPSDGTSDFNQFI